MRIGLIGVGRIGRLHAGRLAMMPQVESVVVCDRDSVIAHTVASEYSFDVAETTEELLASGIDALVVATPTRSHFDIVRRAIDAGLPVFVEKPATATIEEAIELVRLSEERGTLVQVGFMRRFDPGFKNCRIAVRSGILGFVHTLRANTNDVTPPSSSHVMSAGGIFLDANIHDFDAIRWVTGSEVTSVSAMGGNKGGGAFVQADDVDTGAALLQLADGTVAMASASRFNGAGHDVRLEVMGEIGSICAGLDENVPMASAEPGVRLPRGDAEPAFTHRFADAYTAELEAFVDAIAAGTPSQVTLRDGLEALRIAVACTISRREGRRVQMSEIPAL